MNKKEYLEVIKQWKLENKKLIENEKCRIIFLDILPKCRNKGVSWSICKNIFVYFIYEDIEDWIKIIDFNKETGLLKVEYNSEEKYISYRDFKKYRLAKVLDKRTKNFKIALETRFQDNKRDLTITDKEYRKDKRGQDRKWYKYTCNKCGWTEGWITEGALDKGDGCSCCYGRTVVENINSIVATDSWMIKYFQGGYNEAKLYTKTGGGNPNNREGKIYPICPDCGRVRNKKISVNDIYNDKSIGCSCGDGIPYPEKFMFSVLEQSGVDFKTQLSKSNFKWCDKYKYDFYFKLNDEDFVIETHGNQHYEEGFQRIKSNKKTRTLKEEQQNDKYKKELALKNGIKEENYIVIDCRKSELRWIKEYILQSRLNELFDLSKIDWMKAEEFAINNLVKIVCDIKRDNPNLTLMDIEKLNGLTIKYQTILKYIKIGTEFGWCSYNQFEEKSKSAKNIPPDTSKPIEMFKDNILIKNFKSATELERQSEKLFGIKLFTSGIRRICDGINTQYKGYTFKYISKEEYEKRKAEDNLKQAI